jgi:chitinase
VTGGTDASTWTPGTANTYAKLSVTFTPTASTATIYVHGWYAQPTYQADDLTLT